MRPTLICFHFSSAFFFLSLIDYGLCNLVFLLSAKFIIFLCLHPLWLNLRHGWRFVHNTAGRFESITTVDVYVFVAKGCCECSGPFQAFHYNNAVSRHTRPIGTDGDIPSRPISDFVLTNAA
mmetsp:Transcript_25541/g.78713  ORF Transcript_25541/g.78713 Transcript_25541/m.78713 type:complete len:122 (-) Transcript_25541:1138-1503(-)